MKKIFTSGFYVMVATVLIVNTATTYKGDHGKYFEISKNIEIFTNLYKELNTYYVDELDPSKLMRTGIDAMLASLDPYTNYISESDIEGYRFITEGKYTGIGAKFKLIDNFPTITETYEETPAQKAGLKPGDIVLEIDGRSAKARTPEDVNDIMKGYPGTNVDLKVERPGEKEPIMLQLTREEVSVPNVPYSGLIGDDIGYAALTTFTREAGKNVADALSKLKAENPNLKGMVLDLRGNGGGLLTEAVNLCNVFIPKDQLVVSIKGKIKDWDRSFNTLGNPVDEEIPLIVLINKNSASASEIVSGTLQDYDRAVLLGQRSYGKGLVQNTHDVGYNAKLKVTTSKYYIPSGRCIQAVSYKDGEPVHIPDDERAVFKTENGRKVLDGGGVKPDVVLDKDENSNILEILDEENLIFNFVTQYVLNHPTIAEPENYHFDDWNGFIKFLEDNNFDYNTELEKILKSLNEKAKEVSYVVDTDIQNLEQKIIAAKRSELEKNKDNIVNEIEKEIVSRYYFQNGKVKISLRNDPEIKESIKLLNNPQRMKEILKK
ncbi:MAG: S41 family peptidase [Saprospiraceae bacterium]